MDGSKMNRKTHETSLTQYKHEHKMVDTHTHTLNTDTEHTLRKTIWPLFDCH